MPYNKEVYRAWAERNKERRREYTRRWHSVNKHKRREYHLKYYDTMAHRKRTYGLTDEALRKLFEGNPTCSICGDPPKQGRDLCIDHNHATGRVRALLCTRCNTAIGSLRDNPELCENAAAYLRKHAPEGNTSWQQLELPF